MENQPNSTPIKVRVLKHLPLGLFVELENGQHGIIRFREVSWQAEEILNWRKHFPIGWEGEATPITTRKGQLREFSLRLTDSDPWDNLPEEIDPTRIYDGIVTGVTGYGAFIEIGTGLTGLLHNKQLPGFAQDSTIDLFWPGDHVRVSIKSIDRAERKISLMLAPQPDHIQARLPASHPERAASRQEGDVVLDSYLKTDIPRHHILLIEDEAEQALSVGNWLMRIGQRVDVVDNAEKALEFLEKSLPDMALVDVGLPGMNGIELARTILQKWPHVRVITTTDWSRADDMLAELDQLQELGAELLIKPIMPEDLVLVLKHKNNRGGLPALERNEPTPVSAILTDAPTFKADSSIQELLQQCRKHLGYEQAILFMLEPVHRTVEISEHSGEAFLNKSAIASLVFSPVRDVAESRKVVLTGELQQGDRNRFRYLLELCPTLVTCIGVPVPVKLQDEYALFLMDKHPKNISHEQKIYAEAVALAIGVALEQNAFREKSMHIQRTALIGHLTRSMVHEINNLIGPLTTRVENLQLNLAKLEKNSSQPDAKEKAKLLISNEMLEIQASIRRIVNTTRMFGRIVSKGKNEVLRVDEIIDETIRLLRDTSERYHTQIFFTPPQQLIVIRNQAAALEQVLLNVMLNAVQQIAEFKPDASGWVHIRIEQHCSDNKNGFFRVLVEDNGPGIHANLWEKIFEAGYTTRHDGSGIGLYISRNLIGELGGKIYVQQSYILGGTIFAVEIPCHL